MGVDWPGFSAVAQGWWAHGFVDEHLDMVVDVPVPPDLAKLADHPPGLADAVVDLHVKAPATVEDATQVAEVMYVLHRAVPEADGQWDGSAHGG